MTRAKTFRWAGVLAEAWTHASRGDIGATQRAVNRAAQIGPIPKQVLVRLDRHLQASRRTKLKPNPTKRRLQLVFTDVDGTKYFRDSKGDLVDKSGRLVTLSEERNIRQMLARNPRRRHAKRRTNNPWAICGASVERKRKRKFERCVRHVKGRLRRLRIKPARKRK